MALPSRDRGVDLIAYADIDKQYGRFLARPIQMKAAARCSFGIWRKYLKIHDLILAFVWHLDRIVDPETYALTCSEALAVGDAMGWTRSESWIERGGYIATNPGATLRRHLQKYRMTPEKWWTKTTQPPVL
ncbi:MAG TPA: hypothetical protein VJ801_00835 [Polyangia bacterium]|nr:hypothetical protein [Polyangia bacterium]